MPGPARPPAVPLPPAATVPEPAPDKPVGGEWSPEALSEALRKKYPEHVRGYHVAGDQFVDMAPEAAEKAFRAGHVRFDAEQEVHVQLPDGRTGTVPARELGETLDQGASLISPRAARDAYLESKYGDTGKGVAAATGIGFGEGLSGGITDLGLDESQAEASKFIRDRHPMAGNVGQVGGFIAGAAVLPGGGVGGIAEEGAAAAGARGATSFMGRMAQSAVRQGARGAAEGVQFAHQEAVSEQALGAPPLTAQKYWASLGESALFGGALGAVSGVASSALKAGAGAASRAILGRLGRATAGDVDAVAERTFGFVPKGLGDAYVKVASAAAGGGEDIIREAGIQNQSAAAKALRRELLHVDEVRDSAAREVREHVDTMLRGTESLTDEAKGGLKREYVRGAVERGNEPAVAQHATDTIASARGEIGAMLGDAETFGQKQLLTRMDQELGRYESKISTAAKAGDNAEQFALLDDAKRAVGRWTRATKATSIRSASDPITLRQAQATYGKLDELYEGLRANLENEGVWGKAAADQRAINGAWTEQIAADKQFRGALATVVGEERFGGKVYGADPQKVTAYVAGLTNPDKDLVHQAVARYTKATRDLARAVGDSYDLPPAKLAAMKRVIAASEAADKTLAATGQKLAKANQLKALIDAEGHGAGAFAHGMAGAGLMSGHPVGAALGMLSTAVSSPGKSILRLAQLERMTANFDRAMGAHVDAFLARGAAKAEAGGGRPIALTRRVRQGEHSRLAGAAAAEASGIRQQYAERAAAVRQWQENPAVIHAKVAEHVEGLLPHAPETAGALPAVAGRAAAFLASKLPQPGKRDTLFGKDGAPSDAEQSKFLRYWRAATKPESVGEDLAKGRVTAEGVEALRAVYPDIYDELRGGVMRKLASHDGGISYQQRVQLGTAFDVDAAPSLAPSAVVHAQAVFTTPPAKTPGQGKGAGKPMTVARDATTPEQKLEQPRT